MTSPSLSARLFKLGIGLTLIVTGLAVAGLLFIPYHRAKETRAWPKAPCTITESYEKEARTGDLADSTHRVFIRYRYTVDGQVHASTHVQRRTFAGAEDGELSFKSADKAKAKEVLDKYPSGLETTCWVNPTDPTDALLEHQSGASVYAIWFPLLFAVGGAGIAWHALRRQHPADKAKPANHHPAGGQPAQA